MEDLITNAAILFDDKAASGAGLGSPPLPPAPTGQSAPNYSYGSAHTKVASVPASMPTSVRQPGQLQSPEDFTPRLPPRPGNSIHPSARTSPTSSVDAAPTLSTRPGQGSTSKLEKPAPPLPHESAPPQSASSTLVAREGGDEKAHVVDEQRDNMSVQESATLSAVPSQYPQTPNTTAPSLSASTTSVSVSPGGADSPPLVLLPGGFPS
jgi:hypothetical protein